MLPLEPNWSDQSHSWNHHRRTRERLWYHSYSLLPLNTKWVLWFKKVLKKRIKGILASVAECNDPKSIWEPFMLTPHSLQFPRNPLCIHLYFKCRIVREQSSKLLIGHTITAEEIYVFCETICPSTAIDFISDGYTYVLYYSELSIWVSIGVECFIGYRTIIYTKL